MNASSTLPLRAKVTDSATFSLERHLQTQVWGMATLYGLLIYLVLPDMVAAINDDFGYLKSVIHTLQRHRPWTDDWLEPWSASLSWLAAGVYRITHNFRLTIHGLMGVLSAASFWACARLWMDIGVRRIGAFTAAALLLTFPTILWKSVEFTGVILYIPCLLLALLAAKRQRWFLFLAAWGFAVATRQSALAWLALPFYSLLTAAVSKSNRRWNQLAGPVVVLAAGLAFFLFMRAYMNKTHSQILLTDHTFDHFHAGRIFQGLATSLLVFAEAVGLARLLLWAVGRMPSTKKLWGGKRTMLWLALAALMAAVDLRTLVIQEHRLFEGPLGWCYWNGLIVLSVAGWLMGGISIRRDFGLAALGAAALVALRSTNYDYYFLDVFIIGLFALSPVFPKLADAPASAPAYGRQMGLRLALLLGVFHLLFVAKLKLHIDRESALCHLYETALRNHKIEPPDLNHAPFGLKGWYLYPYYITDRGKSSPDIAGCVCYLRPDAVSVLEGNLASLNPPVDPHTILATETHRLGWFFKSSYSLVKNAYGTASPQSPPISSGWRFTPYPLTEEDWRVLAGQAPNDHL